MKKQISLKRELGLFETTIAGVGIIFGAGIYTLIGKAAGLSGNTIWISFLLASLVAVFTGLSYAELSSLFPKSSAEYEYTKKSFGRMLAFVIGWLIIIGGIIASATVAIGFAGYFGALFNTPVIPTALGLILVLSFILFYGIKLSIRITIISTLIETAGLLLIIVIGIPHLGSVNYFEMPGIGGVFAAAALIFFAFMGFEEIVRLSEETRKPKKVIPRALLISIAITTIIYVLVGLSAVSVINWQTLGTSEAPLADIAAQALGTDIFVILSVIALFATSNTVLLLLLASSRLTYGMARAHSLPIALAHVHPKRRTPWVSIIIIMIFAMMFVFFRDITVIANLTNFTLFVTFIVINAAVIILRYKKPNMRRPFKTPINIGRFPVLPVIGIFFCVFMLTNIGFQIVAYGLVLIITGTVVYKLLK